jgi:hypothetical protein
MRNTLEPVYNVLDWDDSRDRPILVLLLSVFSERAITLYHYQLESNPLVLSMGKVYWSILTVILVGMILLLWYTGGYERTTDRILVYAISAFHLVAFYSNLYVVYLA